VSTAFEEMTSALAVADLELDVVSWLSCRRRALLEHDTRAAEHAQTRLDRSLEALAVEYARQR
jgi:hypothetical protein